MPPFLSGPQKDVKHLLYENVLVSGKMTISKGRAKALKC